MMPRLIAALFVLSSAVLFAAVLGNQPCFLDEDCRAQCIGYCSNNTLSGCQDVGRSSTDCINRCFGMDGLYGTPGCLNVYPLCECCGFGNPPCS